MSSSSLVSRRTFFGATAGAAAATLVPATATRSAVAAPAAGKALRLGIASYSFRKLPLDKVIEACQGADIRNITLKDMHLPRTEAPEATRAAVDKLKAAGITVMGGGVINWKPAKDKPLDLAALEAQARKDFEYAKTAGFPVIVCSPVPEALDVVEKLVKEFGIPVAIHNHGPEDQHWKTPKDILTAVKKRDKRIGVCMDIGHTFRAGADPAKAAAECGPRLLDLHIKDLVKNPNPPADATPAKGMWTQVEVGRGVLDLVALFKQLQKMKFQGHVALEYEINENVPVPGVRESFAYMRGIAAALGALEVRSA